MEVKLDIQFVEDKVYQDLLAGLGLSAAEYTGQEDNMIIAGILPGYWYTQEEPMEFTIRSKDSMQTKTILLCKGLSGSAAHRSGGVAGI